MPRYPAQRASRLKAEVVKLIEHARRELLYGAPRTRVWLRRRHQGNVSVGAIQRTFDRLKSLGEGIPLDRRFRPVENPVGPSLSGAVPDGRPAAEVGRECGFFIWASMPPMLGTHVGGILGVLRMA